MAFNIFLNVFRYICDREHLKYDMVNCYKLMLVNPQQKRYIRGSCTFMRTSMEKIVKTR